MARDFNGTTDFGVSNSSVNLSTFKAFAEAFWFKFDGTPSGSPAPISQFTRNGAGAFYATLSPAVINVYFQTSAGLHGAATAGSPTLAAGTWYLIGYNIDSTQTASYFVRNIWLGALGGGNPADYLNSSSGDLTATFGATDTIRFSKPGNGSNAFPGALERAGLWAAASGSILTQANMNALVTGTDPTTIQAGSLQHYWPFLGNTNPEPDSGGSPITVAITGTTQVSGPFAAGGAPRFSLESLGLSPLSGCH
jgi:hypothetical protein